MMNSKERKGCEVKVSYMNGKVIGGGHPAEHF